jgi:hypothetical protein
MPPMDRRRLLLSGLALGAGAASARSPVSGAQSLPAKPRVPTVFEQTIPAPTGVNGYEELVGAVDQLRSSSRFQQVEKLSGAPASVPLSLKRRVLSDPPVVRALALLRRGLAKTITSPRKSLDSSTLLPEMAGFRQLARLLAMQQYVYLADGRVSEAIGTARVCLRLGQAVQTDTLISGLVGIAISAICLRSLGAHLDQLGVADCNRLNKVCLEWLGQPDPMPQMLNAERQAGKSLLAEIKASDREGLERIFGVGPPPQNSEDSPEMRQLISELTRVAASPGGLDAVLEEAERRLDQYYAHILAESQKHAWERTWPRLPDDGSLTARLLSAVAVSPVQVADKYSGEEAMVRLLACHTAILRYRWEYDRVPPDLAVLNLGDLALDPFTGQPLKYQPSGRKYRLASVGWTAADDDPRAVDGRRPLLVTPDE